VLADPDESTKRQYQLGATPSTIVISRNAKAVKTWLGAWAGRTGDEIESWFGLKLPGMQN
jgi:hypothetical protein